jgi:flagella basal body P-ring formation protein FlgA
VKVQLAFPGRPSVNGIVPLKFIIFVDGEEYERRTVLFRVEVLKEVLVASRALDRHEVIEEDDVQLALRDIGMLSNIFSQKDSLIGKRTKKIIPDGSIIVGDMVEVPPIIKQGDMVKIIIESQAFRITAQGKARQAGAYGSIIRVMNTLSMKEITAQVIDEKSVRVSF